METVDDILKRTESGKDTDLEHFDVVIIGGNIAGAYLAYLISKSGIKTVVIEEHKETGLPLQCAGIISKKLADIVELDPSIVINEVNIARIYSPSGTYLELKGNESPLIVDRTQLDKSFYKKAAKSGAKFYFNEKFLTYKKLKNKFIIVKTNKRKIRAKLIVGCDGPLSKVAKINGIKPSFIYGVQVRARYPLPNDITEMYFNHDYKELFGWIIPEGNGICRIGMGCLKNPGVNFKRFLSDLNINLPEIINRQGGLIPFGYMKKIAFDRAILLGDSANMVKATTGGGIIMLLSAAKVASEAIINGCDKNSFSEKLLTRYYEKDPEIRRLKIELKIHYFIRLILQRFTSNDFDRFFYLYKMTDIKKIIQQYADMDFPKRLMLKLIFNKSFLRFIISFIIRNFNILSDFIHLISEKSNIIK